MSETTIGKIPKPAMRDLLRKQIRRNLIGCFIFCSTIVIGMKYLYCEPNKRAYAEFYKNYNIDKEFNKMRRKGLFDSCDENAADEDCV